MRVAKTKQVSKGLQIQRVFTKDGKSPFEQFEYDLRTSVIKNPDGSTVFELKNVEVPKGWSQVATDILAQKYFRKAGVPQFDKDGKAILDATGKQVTGSETSVKQVVYRLARTWRVWGERNGYFASSKDAQAYEEEMVHMLLNQLGAPNSPQWFNTGLAEVYGIKGTPQGHWFVDEKTGVLQQSKDAYSRPAPHACFIQSVNDDLVNPGGIFDLATKEARVFKYGSGTGSNFSKLRGANEKLSGGGKSSGLMGWLRIYDRAAGAIKSGGTTRRAAKMVVLDLDHPEIETFVNWKMKEEQKVAALVAGSKLIKLKLDALMRLAIQLNQFDLNSPSLKANIAEIRNQQMIPMNYVVKALALAKQGYLSMDLKEFDTHYESEAYDTVSGQNSNNSVRISNAFLNAVEKDGDWNLTNRTDGKVAKTMKARELWEQIALAAWASADPGVQFQDTINEWHTVPKDGVIEASNPCVTGDTLVATAHGFKPIAELVGKEESVIGADGWTHPVKKIFSTGIKQVFELETKAGYKVKLTADHKVTTLNRGDVPAKELNENDVLVLKSPKFGRDSLDVRLAEVLGAAIGDGCVVKGKNPQLVITLGKHEKEMAEHLNKNLNSYKSMNRQLMASEKRHCHIGVAPTQLRIITGSRPVVDRLKEFAILDEGSENKGFTNKIYGLRKEELAAVLRGLYSTDGTVGNYGGGMYNISLDSTSLKLLEQTQRLLLSFGIKSKMYGNRLAGKTTKILPDGKGGHKEYAVKPMWSLRITCSSRLVFEEKIGFLKGCNKTKKLKELNQGVTAYLDKFEDKFKSLKYLGEENVFDLTEPMTHHFVANGLVISNCSEYLSVSNSACNLASINLVKLLRADGTFDVEAYRHAIRLWTIALEISVVMAQFPGKEIAQVSYDIRNLGLGFANLGTLLMQWGIPYDSQDAQGITGAVSAILTGQSYATSAEMAKAVGAFAHYPANKEDMLRVIRNHRRAAYCAPDIEYEGLSVKPVGINPKFCPASLLAHAKDSWDEALRMGEKYGYRNSQVSVIAPTGTIGLLMDCDTTGVEPDFALVKFKKLAGGGYFKIVNGSIIGALKKLGYSDLQIRDIEDYAKGRGTLVGCPFVNPETLSAMGFTNRELEIIQAQLKTAFDIKFVFNKYSLGEEFCKKVLKLTDAQLADQKLNLLRAIGFKKEEVQAANEYVCGTMTVEGAPHLKLEHYSVFDCANKCGAKGKRFIPYQAHIEMMGACQSFISGAISKTINMPNEATIEEVKRVYAESHALGVKALALYRDGSKLSQPLNVTSDEEEEPKEEKKELGGVLEQIVKNPAVGAKFEAPAVQAEEVTPLAVRERLPARRQGFTQEFKIGGQKFYLRTGEYADGRLGEVFIDGYKPGAGYKGLLNSFAVLASKALQYGVPLEELVDTFTFTRFEPSGLVQLDLNIKNATSILDYAFRLLGSHYLGRTDLVHIKPH